MPGYVFVEINLAKIEFQVVCADFIRNSTEIFKLLKNGNSNIAISLQERKRFEYLYKADDVWSILLDTL